MGQWGLCLKRGITLARQPPWQRAHSGERALAVSHHQPTLPEAGEVSASVLKGGLGGTPVSTAAGQASRTTESVLRKAIPLRVFYCLFRGLGKKEFRGGYTVRNRKLCSASKT